MGTDFGYHVHKFPYGVLQPQSVEDIQKVLRFAKKNSLKVTMRGIGGAAYGQTQFEDGITIDSSTFNKIKFVGNKYVDVQPGALWSQVVDFAMKRNLAPPVLPDTLQISVGGTLSVGGIGETSYRLGAQVDHVTEMDVVTADGKFVRCSPVINSELFNLILGGMGQYGIIVRVRLKLIDAPAQVQVREIKYPLSDLPLYLSDIEMIVQSEASGAVGGDIVKNPDGTWTPVITVTTWPKSAVAPSWLKNTHGSFDGQVKESSFYDYMHRSTKGYLNAQKSGALFTPHAYMAFFLPSYKVGEMVNFILTAPDASLGAGKLVVVPEIRKNFSVGLLSLPESEIIYHMRIYRKSPQADTPDHLKMLQMNQDVFVPKILAAGGTVYLPFSPLLTPEQKPLQFGSQIWAHMLSAKHKFDPGLILAPGVGLFDSTNVQLCGKEVDGVLRN